MKVSRSDSRSLFVIFLFYHYYLLESKRLGLHSLPKVDVNEFGFTPLDDGIWMSKSTTVNKNGFTFFSNGGCQSLLPSTRMGLHTLLMVDVKVYYSSQEWVYILC